MSRPPSTTQRSNTLPLAKNAPPRTAIRKHETAPRAPLADLDNSLPRTTKALVVVDLARVAAGVLDLAREANDLAARALDRQFRRLGLAVRHGGAGGAEGAVVAVRVVGAGRRG